MKKQTPGRPCGSSKNVKQDLMISAIFVNAFVCDMVAAPANTGKKAESPKSYDFTGYQKYAPSKCTG